MRWIVLLMLGSAASATACASGGPLDAPYYPGVEPALQDRGRAAPAPVSSAQARAR